MSTMKKITFAVLFVLFSGSSVAYLVHLQQKSETLKQRITELTQKLEQARYKHSKTQLKQSVPVGNNALKELAISSANHSNQQNKKIDTLTKAVLAGDLDALRPLIESGANLSAVDENGQNLLEFKGRN